MQPHLKFLVLIFVLAGFIAVFGSSNTAQAQSSALPDNWCQQPSDVKLQYSQYSQHYTEQIGASQGGIRAVYQPYNQRIVLERTEPREVVQVVENGVALNTFRVLRYTDNCRYLIAILRDEQGTYSTAVYDLVGGVGRIGAVVRSGRNWQTVESSPEGTYLLVTANDGLYLWNFTTNIQTHLTSLKRSDCELVGLVGCSGDFSTYREARWDVPHSLLQLDLISNYTVTLNLPAATISRVEATPRYSYYHPTASPNQLIAAAAEYGSNYACMPRVQYQTYNHRVVMVERYAHQLVGVLEDNLDLTGFQFLGWSATCTYAAAAIEDADGLRLVAWNVNDMTRRERPLTDWVDRYSWETSGDTINVVTDGGSFTWNLNAS